jgi:hypothetical protein
LKYNSTNSVSNDQFPKLYLDLEYGDDICKNTDTAANCPYGRVTDPKIGNRDWKNRTNRCNQTQGDYQFQSKNVAARQFHAGFVLKRSDDTSKTGEGDS